MNSGNFYFLVLYEAVLEGNETKDDSFIFSFSVFVRKSLVDRLSCLLSALEFQMFSGSCTVCNGTLTIESEYGKIQGNH